MKALSASLTAALLPLGFLVVLLAGCQGSRNAAPLDAEPVLAEEVGGAKARQEAVRAGRSEAVQRQRTRDARLRLRVTGEEAVGRVLDEADALTESLEGYVAVASTGGRTLRIPDARLEEALRRLEALGEVVQREVRATDVTARYTDLQIQIDNARALQRRLRTLLDEAEGVEAMLAVERELARVTAQLERLEGRQRLLQNQVDYATLHLTVREERQLGPLGAVVYGLYRGVRWLFVRR